MHQQRKNDIEKHINEELILQKDLEEDLRLAQEPQQKNKFKKQIKEVKVRISEYQTELGSLFDNQQKQESLVSAMTTLTFRELDMVTSGILCMPISAEANYTVLPPVTKMLKNELTKDLVLEIFVVGLLA
ncbi:MAG: hypothetical protein V7K59_02700 [Nostoc sp.]